MGRAYREGVLQSTCGRRSMLRVESSGPHPPLHRGFGTVWGRELRWLNTMLFSLSVEYVSKSAHVHPVTTLLSVSESAHVCPVTTLLSVFPALPVLHLSSSDETEWFVCSVPQIFLSNANAWTQAVCFSLSQTLAGTKKGSKTSLPIVLSPLFWGARDPVVVHFQCQSQSQDTWL